MICAAHLHLQYLDIMLSLVVSWWYVPTSAVTLDIMLSLVVSWWYVPTSAVTPDIELPYLEYLVLSEESPEATVE